MIIFFQQKSMSLMKSITMITQCMEITVFRQKFREMDAFSVGVTQVWFHEWDYFSRFTIAQWKKLQHFTYCCRHIMFFSQKLRETIVFTTHTTYYCGNYRNSLSPKIFFRQINYLVISLARMLLSRNFCQKWVKVNFRNIHIEIFFRQINSLVIYTVNALLSRNFCQKSVKSKFP